MTTMSGGAMTTLEVNGVRLGVEHFVGDAPGEDE